MTNYYFTPINTSFSDINMLLFISFLVAGLLLQALLHNYTERIGYYMTPNYKYAGYSLTLLVWYLTLSTTGKEWTSSLIILLIAASILITTALIDMVYMELPNEYNVALALLGLLYIYLATDVFIVSFTYIISGIIAFSIYLIMMIITGSVGGGDVKMALGIGFFMSYAMLIHWFLLTFLFGAIVAVYFIITKKKTGKDYFPFGPFMAFSAIYLLCFLL